METCIVYLITFAQGFKKRPGSTKTAVTKRYQKGLYCYSPFLCWEKNHERKAIKTSMKHRYVHETSCILFLCWQVPYAAAMFSILFVFSQPCVSFFSHFKWISLLTVNDLFAQNIILSNLLLHFCRFEVLCRNKLIPMSRYHVNSTTHTCDNFLTS